MFPSLVSKYKKKGRKKEIANKEQWGHTFKKVKKTKQTYIHMIDAENIIIYCTLLLLNYISG